METGRTADGVRVSCWFTVGSCGVTGWRLACDKFIRGSAKRQLPYMQYSKRMLETRADCRTCGYRLQPIVTVHGCGVANYRFGRLRGFLRHSIRLVSHFRTLLVLKTFARAVNIIVCTERKRWTHKGVPICKTDLFDLWRRRNYQTSVVWISLNCHM
jgi:hypothetical protein